MALGAPTGFLPWFELSPTAGGRKLGRREVEATHPKNFVKQSLQVEVPLTIRFYF